MAIKTWKKYGFWGYSIKLNGEENIWKLVEEGDVVFDCGANRGEWTNLLMAHTKNIGKEVYCFEPQPIKALDRNVLGARIIRKAVSDKNETLQFWLDGMTSAIFNHGGQHTKMMVVEAVSLDWFCDQNGIEKIDILKLDLEGAEWRALRGCWKRLKEGNVKVIQFEYESGYKTDSVTLERVIGTLRVLGYVVYMISPDDLFEVREWYPQMENYKYANYLAVLRKSSKFDRLIEAFAG